MESVVHGRNVNGTSAQKLCGALGLPLSKLFKPVPRGPLSGKTQLHYHRFLSATLETAVQWQYIPSYPCARVKPPKVVQAETAYLDEKGAAALMAALDSEPIQYRTIVLLLSNTADAAAAEALETLAKAK